MGNTQSSSIPRVKIESVKIKLRCVKIELTVVPLWASVVSNSLSFLLCTFLLVGLTACAPGTNLLGSGSWQASTLASQHIQSLAVDSVSSQKLYAGTEDGTLFSSNDAGLHWTKRTPITTTPIELLMLVVNPSAKTLYALTNNGLFASNDGAQTWQIANTPNSGLPSDSYTTMIFDEERSIYIGTLHHGVFMSSNGAGTHWQAINGTLPASVAIHELAFDSLQHRLWAATSLGAYRSDNNGTTWNAFNTGLPSTDGVDSIQPAASFGGASGLVYAGTKHGIFRTVDNGAHWSESGQVLQGVPIEHILIDYRTADASTLYVGTRFGVFRSDDSGQNWLGVAGGFPKNTSVYALAIGAEKDSQLYVAANNVYLFPGTDTSLNPTRVVTLLLILVFFGLLMLMTRRSITRRKTLFRPRGISEEQQEDHEGLPYNR